MPLPSQIISRRMHLPRAQTEDVLCDRDLRIPMGDGTILLADRHVARARAHTPQPTVLVRSPYGRRQLVGLIFGRLLAERGLQVLVQSVRGTFGSEGEFSPFDERSDGLATLRWIREQSWHSEKIGMIGPSYLGIVQWAVATEAGEDLAALSIQVSASQFHGQTYAGGSLALETAASWLVMVAAQERRLAPVAMARGLRRLGPLLEQMPVGEIDALATGAEVPWFRQALASPAREDAYWVARDFAAGVGNVAAPVQLIGGWYDIFLPWMLEDFAALQAAGRSPQLVIGPWTHVAPGLMASGMREGLAWLRAHLLGDERLLSPARVRIQITGERTGGGWRELPAWPPPGMTERRLYLAARGELSEVPPAQAPRTGATQGDPAHNGGAPSADLYRYDPADPTPSFGGPVLLANAPVLDNRPLEARPDVLTYTTGPLPRTVEAIGPVRVEIFVRTSSPHFDLFARVCDVYPDGPSLNVCDALARALPGRFENAEDGSTRVAFELWPIGHRFAAGNRIRLQVSSGAHPRYARNPGTGEDLATATETRPVDVEILHDAEHASVLVLPAA
jgi:putative CocE/NonD family hydrolase